ncbi:hypothetical protein GA0074692_6844 [Micromonospora pallida]|uniref:Uncharacterized protein n=1 Tax=Micromonospora pallida TaxID=145854 RepID=A0A1C6TKU2_9ACTN|nr:hypothetical protein [Micromonospora pallida]SCL42165.1 hypothetical protein GA0074692_6689 [Micromonospora pallida]SCL43363.1 hypothetical protein GA0074692_6844 [Micromonospora pallida]
MSSGTHEALAIEISDAATLDLWAIMDRHAPSYGVCQQCRRRCPCPARAEARAELILAGRLNQPRPATPADPRTQSAAGE